MKTKQELENIKERLEKLSAELHELTDEELEQVTGGAGTDVAKVESGLGGGTKVVHIDGSKVEDEACTY